MSRRIAIASLIWGSSILLSRVIGLVREAVIGRVLGGGADASVFWTAFVVPDFLNYLLAGGALSIVFIPIFSSYVERGEHDRGWEAFSAVANVLTALLLASLLGLWAALPWLVGWVAPGFDPAQHAQLISLTRIVLPAQAFHVLGGLLSATLQARDRHALPALAPLVYTACIVAGGLIGGVEAGGYGFAWGVLVGSVLGPFGLPLLGAWRAGIAWRPILRPGHPDVRTYLVRSLPIMLGWSIMVVDDWFLKRLGSLISPTAISTLQYAKTLMKVPMGVLGVATGVAAFPTLTRLVAQGRPDVMYATLAQAVRRMLILALGAQVVLTAAGEEVSRLVYGAKIPLSQHVTIGSAIALMCLALWAWSAQTVIARGFYAVGNTWLPVVAGTVVAVLAYPLYAAMGRVWAEHGLALASAVAVSVYTFVLIALLRRRYAGVRDGFVPFFVQMAVAVAVAIGAALGLRQAVGGTWPWLLRGVAAAAAGAVVYGAMLWALRVRDAREVYRLVVGRLLPRGAGLGGAGGGARTND